MRLLRTKESQPRRMGEYYACACSRRVQRVDRVRPARALLELPDLAKHAVLTDARTRLWSVRGCSSFARSEKSPLRVVQCYYCIAGLGQGRSAVRAPTKFWFVGTLKEVYMCPGMLPCWTPYRRARAGSQGRRAGARGMLRALLVACTAGLPFRAAATFLQPQCFVPVNMDGFTNDVGLSEAMWAGVAEKPGRLHTQNSSGSHFCVLTPKAFGARAHHAWACVEPRVQRKPKRGACHLGATTRGFAVARV